MCAAVRFPGFEAAAMRSFRFTSEYSEGRLVVRVIGELDLAAAPEVSEALSPRSIDGYEAVVVDLSGLDFIDSSGIRVFCRAAETAREHGVSFRLVEPSRNVARTLEIAGVAGWLRDVRS
jgi:anti-anti-sigma factor